MYILIFSPPAVDPVSGAWIIFAWLVVTLCLFDTCESIYTVNYNSLYPDKFRDRAERVTLSTICVYIGYIGVVLANIVPPIVIVYGDPGSFTLMAWICVIIVFFSWFLMLPGVRDDKECVENYLAICETEEKEPFFKTLKKAFTLKAFVAFFFFYICYQTLTTTVQASFLYWIRFIIEGDAGDILFVMVMLLLGGMVSLPIWFYYNKKTSDNRKSMLVGAICLFGLTFIFSAIFDLIFLLILALFWGMSLAGFWFMIDPVYADVIDEIVVETGERREGVYMGFRSFMSNLSKVLQALIFATVHELTGFVEGAETQSSLAQIGILLHFGVIPAAIMAFGFLIFWRVYDITPEKSTQLREKLKELKF
jgi:GPH family glycoside/pentoside/hexuronide:cation symporter